MPHLFHVCLHFPENSTLSPVDVLSLPWPVQRSSLTPSMLRLYFRISAVSIAVLPTSFRVRTFHQPIFFIFFAFNILWVDTFLRGRLCLLLIEVLASSWLSLVLVMLCSFSHLRQESWGASQVAQVSKLNVLNVRVSVILSFFRKWVIGPSPNP